MACELWSVDSVDGAVVQLCSELSAMPSHKAALASHIAVCLCVAVHSRVAVFWGLVVVDCMLLAPQQGKIHIDVKSHAMVQKHV